MGCKTSKFESHDDSTPKQIGHIIIPEHPQQNNNELRMIDTEIEDLQEIARQRDEDKVKLLLLGTGESGKSTIFKQFRILYGTEKSDEDLQMYGMIVRSNIVTAVRRLCMLTRQMGFEEKLDEESKAAVDQSKDDHCGMTVSEAYDQLVAYIVDHTATEPFPPISKEQAEQDWVGKSSWVGAQQNENSMLFLQHVEAMRVLWQVSTFQLSS